MRLPSNSRRKFLLKSTLVLGLIPFVRSFAFAGSSAKGKAASIRTFHGSGTFENSFMKDSNLSLDEFHHIFIGKQEIGFIGNEKGSFGDGGSNYQLSTSLYGRNQVKIPVGELEETHWINSNLAFEGSLFQDKVSPYQIIDFSGYKIGLLGIGFVDASQSISVTIKKMNEVSAFLKNSEGCDLVYCLTDCPTQVFPHFRPRDLVENSGHIDRFFVSSKVHGDDRLLVLPNVNGHQVLLSQKSTESLSVGMTEVGEDKIMRQRKLG